MARQNVAVDAHWYARPEARTWRCEAPPRAPEAFHRSMPGYRSTRLVELTGLADELGVGRVFVKDESSRLGVPAFKILGASWAVCRAVGALHASAPSPWTFDELQAFRSSLGSIRLVAATDGNHGRAVARMASLLHASAHIFVPDVVEPAAIALIEAEGAAVTVVEDSYDATVERAARSAAEFAAEFAAEDAQALLVQDTAWPGYEQIPQWIVDGYSTLFHEVEAQLAALGVPALGLLTVPVGVGSLAQAAVTFHRSTTARPASLLTVEPHSAACVAASLRQRQRVSVPTGRTSMAGLNCGTPSSIAWPFLLNGVDAAISVSDEQAAVAASDLDAGGVSSGPCGAASLAALRAALHDTDGEMRRQQLGLTAESTIVLLNTEGARSGE